ncbi:major histocompatibility complex class I-related gene protein-like [Dromiciops gliroides]|uniref:major histocompatibility complex class I-related gene protein-like n=1 Tax=Dromiciops gliroides TaxID=33562 RepID=UPI001CC4FA7A|nr:major histocompatibility complex class I-related gene protein-like [Dromiciops gliroides]
MGSRVPWYIHGIFLVASCVLLSVNAPSESHSLQYNFFATFQSDGQDPSYSVHGYLDGESLLHYDSKSQRPEPRGSWLHGIVETEAWSKENGNLKDFGEKFLRTLRNVMGQSNLSTDSHTLQAMLGCELSEDGNTRGFWRYGCDGETFLIFHPETLTWEAVHPAASILKDAFEKEPREIKNQKARVEGDCCQQLRSYLEVWKEEKAVFPTLSVTQNKNQDGKVTLRCWAYSFFPWDINMNWVKDGRALNQSDQEGGLIQPRGDGTYQTCVSIDAHPEETNYTCHVVHQGRNQTTSVALESHSLQYNFFATFQSDGQDPPYSVHVYLDGESLLHYDSKSQRPEPRGTWLHGIVETEAWSKENGNLKDFGEKFLRTLRNVMGQSNLSTGSHTLQAMLGCELGEDGNTRGFWRYGCDGKDFLIFHAETLTWEAVHPAASILKDAFEKEPRETKNQKAKVEGDCRQQLWSYLEVWKEEKEVYPSLNVTQKKNQDGRVTLRCWAYSFFPRDIKMTWLQDGHVLNQMDQEKVIILPSGDGTYQSSLSIDVYPEDSNYTCHVEHQGRNQTTSEALEVQQKMCVLPGLPYGGVVAIFLVAAAAIACVKVRAWRRKNVPCKREKHQQNGISV